MQVYFTCRLRRRGGEEKRGPAFASPRCAAPHPAKGPCWPLGTPAKELLYNLGRGLLAHLLETAPELEAILK